MVSLKNKKDIHQACIEHVSNSLEIYQKGIQDAQNSLQSESKSSAGDKHETGRAMLQLEAEKLGSQYRDTLSTLNFLKQLKYNEVFETIQLGSLVETNIGLFYICSGIGSIRVEGTQVFILSPIAPLAKLLHSKTLNDSFIFNRKTILIKSIV